MAAYIAPACAFAVRGYPEAGPWPVVPAATIAAVKPDADHCDQFGLQPESAPAGSWVMGAGGILGILRFGPPRCPCSHPGWMKVPRPRTVLLLAWGSRGIRASASKWRRTSPSRDSGIFDDVISNGRHRCCRGTCLVRFGPGSPCGRNLRATPVGLPLVWAGSAVRPPPTGSHGDPRAQDEFARANRGATKAHAPQ